MSIDPLNAATAIPTDATLAQRLSRGDGPREPRLPPAQGVETDFAALIGEAVAGVAQQLRQAEGVSMSSIKGSASTQEVVEQVMRAEQALQASIAVRDKIIAAYLEISRMAI